MSDVLRVLTEARGKTLPREHFTMGCLARDGLNNPVDPRDPTAVCWCGIGAVIAVAPDSETRAAALAALDDAAREHCDAPDFESVNDLFGHSEAHAVMAHAIAAEQAKTASPSP